MSTPSPRTLWLDRDAKEGEALRSLLSSPRRADAHDGATLQLRWVRSIEEARSRASDETICAALVRVKSTKDGVLDMLQIRDTNAALPIVVVADSDQDAEALFASGAQELLLVGEVSIDSVTRALKCAMDRVHLASTLSPPAMGGGGPVRFGAFELDSRRLELRKDGELIKVHPTPMRLLAHLVENAERVVSKDELLEHVWSGTVVSDFAISSAVKDLRHVLGDDGVRQLYIQTLRGSGYRFAAPQEESVLEVTTEQDRLIAVLPFDCESPDPECSELGQGLVDALVESLSRTSGVRVIAAPALADGAQPLPPCAFARELGVDLLLTGCIRENHDQARVSVQLLDPADGALLWADHFDHAPGTDEGVEETLAGLIQARVQGYVEADSASTGTASSTADEAAYEICLSALYHQKQGTRENLLTARGEYERAIQEAPGHPLAYVGLARVLLALCGYTQNAPRGKELLRREVALPRATIAVGKALALDPSFGPAHAARATILGVFEWEWSEAKMAACRAVQLSPGDAQCQMDHAKLMAAMGNTRWGLSAGRHAVGLDPLNVPLRLDYASLLHWARRPEEALREQRRILAMDGRFPAVNADLGASCHLLGRDAEAVAAWDRLLKQMRFPKDMREELDRAFERAGMSGYWEAWVSFSGHEPFQRYFSPEWLWLPCSRLGDFDAAFEALDQAARKRSEFLAYIHVDPRFDPLRQDPRFERLQQRVGMPS